MASFISSPPPAPYPRPLTSQPDDSGSLELLSRCSFLDQQTWSQAEVERILTSKLSPEASQALDDLLRDFKPETHDGHGVAAKALRPSSLNRYAQAQAAKGSTPVYPSHPHQSSSTQMGRRGAH